MATAGIESDGPPAAKRQRVKQNVILTNLPANEFTKFAGHFVTLTKLDLFNGPRVVVKVGVREFNLPKNLLCYNSKFFDKALNGNFKEGVEQIVGLDGHPIEAFEMVVQWLFQSSVNLPSNIKEEISSDLSAVKAEPGNENSTTKQVSGATTKMKQQIELLSNMVSLYLDFLVLADYIQLIGPFDLIERKISDILIENRCALTPQHVRSAMTFPAGNSARQIIVRATVKDFVEHVRSDKPFKFRDELEVDDAYAAELIREYSKVLLGKFLGANPQDKDKAYVKDPLVENGRILVTINVAALRRNAKRF